jgi:hypothetical protein
MSLSKIRPLERASDTTGEGTTGLDFLPSDREFARIRQKARAVLEGRAFFSNAEISKILARILVDYNA